MRSFDPAEVIELVRLARDEKAVGLGSARDDGDGVVPNPFKDHLPTSREFLRWEIGLIGGRRLTEEKRWAHHDQDHGPADARTHALLPLKSISVNTSA